MRAGCMLVTLNFLLTPLEAAIENSGPYKCTMVSIRSCAKPTLPLDKNPPVLYSAEIYNKTTAINLMRGNFTVVRDTKNKMIKTKGFCWENGKWMIHFAVNIGCNSVIMPLMISVTGISYDKRTCKFKKGIYKIEDFDTNRMQHMWSTTQEYGRIMWRVEYFSHTGSVFCYEYETLVEPEF